MSSMTLDRLAELIEARFQQMDARFEQMDARFEQMDARFEQMDGRIGQMDGRIGQMDGRIGGVEHAVIELRIEMLEQFRRVDTRIDRLSDEMRESFRGIN